MLPVVKNTEKRREGIKMSLWLDTSLILTR